MKNIAIVSLLVTLANAAVSHGQVVANRAPVLVPAQYVTSSSPVGDGRFVTTYRTSTISQPASTVYLPQSVQPQDTYRIVAAPQVAQSRIVYRPAATPYYSGQGTTVQYYAPANAADIAPRLPPTLIQAVPTIVSGATNPYMCQSTFANAGYAPYVNPNRAAFRPIVPFRNIPPGSYVGQGLLGQPKAYVQGQPLRNLFRYIFP
ncbi:MAG: hypothetical protein IH991_01555 [Planctomycetes bacterium]|nr:hypothetical protein [Planctomycetota bacterium]